MARGTIDTKEIGRKFKFEYQFGSKDRVHKIQDTLQMLLSQMNSPAFNFRHFIDEVLKAMEKLFDISQLTIGFRSDDGRYRYYSFRGLTREAEIAHKKLAYTWSEFSNPEYGGMTISKYTKIFLAEDNPYTRGEEKTYNRPVMLESERKTPEQSIEGDYLDIHIFDRKNAIIGWIEISGTKTGMLPKIEDIKCLELIGAIVGASISMHNPHGIGGKQ